MFLNYRSTLDKHNKIGFTNFGQVLLKICFLEALTNFLEIIFVKKTKPKHWVHPVQCNRRRWQLGPTGKLTPHVSRTEAEAALTCGNSPSARSPALGSPSLASPPRATPSRLQNGAKSLLVQAHRRPWRTEALARNILAHWSPERRRRHELELLHDEATRLR
jgi:hypothetical protein